MKFPVHFARVATVIGATAALISALIAGTPAAQASPTWLGITAEVGRPGDPAHQVDKIFVIRPNGTSVEVPHGTDVRSLTEPYYRWKAPARVGDCKPGEMCFWNANHYQGVGLFMGGTFAWCEGFHFEGTIMQDHVYSIWNRVYPGNSSIFNLASDGSAYGKYGHVPAGYAHDTEFTKYMDAWAYDPNKNCAGPYLFLMRVQHP